MKKILLIGTGGTIASEVTQNGLAPELTTEQLLAHIPAISGICEVECIQLLSLDSTNITPEHWLMMAQCIRKNYHAYDGFVLTHGTDTMAYTAAALSYLIQGSPKPIILTGAQKPIGFDSTDSKINLLDAFRCASEDMPGVSIVFNNQVILGTGEDDGLGTSLNQIAQCRRCIGHGIRAVGQHETVIGMIVLPDALGHHQPVLRCDVGAVQTQQLDALHLADFGNGRNMSKQLFRGQFRCQTALGHFGCNGTAGTDQ